jgi:hypothetical protein
MVTPPLPLLLRMVRCHRQRTRSSSFFLHAAYSCRKSPTVAVQIYTAMEGRYSSCSAALDRLRRGADSPRRDRAALNPDGAAVDDAAGRPRRARVQESTRTREPACSCRVQRPASCCGAGRISTGPRRPPSAARKAVNTRGGRCRPPPGPVLSVGSDLGGHDLLQGSEASRWFACSAACRASLAPAAQLARRALASTGEPPHDFMTGAPILAHAR